MREKRPASGAAKQDIEKRSSSLRIIFVARVKSGSRCGPYEIQLA